MRSLFGTVQKDLYQSPTRKAATLLFAWLKSSRKEKFFRSMGNRVCDAKGSYLRRCRNRMKTRRFR